MTRSATAVHAAKLVELRGWYVGGLRPKLTDAVGSGTVSASAAAALDRRLRDFLDLADEPREEAA